MRWTSRWWRRQFQRDRLKPPIYAATVGYGRIGTGSWSVVVGFVGSGTVAWEDNLGTGTWGIVVSTTAAGSVEIHGTATWQIPFSMTGAGWVEKWGTGSWNVVLSTTGQGYLEKYGIGAWTIAYSWVVRGAVGLSAGYTDGVRELEADFESPASVLATDATFDKRPDAITFDYLTAFSMGPKDIADLTEGIASRPWYVRCDNVGQAIYVAKANDANTAWGNEQLLFTFSGTDITELDLAFEQAGRAVVVCERPSGVAGAPEIWLYWYKPADAAFVFENLGSGRTPRCVLDDVEDTTGSDVQLLWFKSGTGLIRREQRENYAIENTTPIGYSDNYYLEELAITRGRRLAAIYSYRDTVKGRYLLKRLESTLYPVYPSDLAEIELDIKETSELYVALIDEVLYDKDLAEVELDIIAASSALASIVIEHELYDKDTAEVELDVLEAGSAMAVVLIDHELYDKDLAEIELDILASGSTMAVVLIIHTIDGDEDTLGAELDIVASTSSLAVA